MNKETQSDPIVNTILLIIVLGAYVGGIFATGGRIPHL